MRPEFLAAAAAIALFALGDALAAAWGKSGRWWWCALMLVSGNLAWVLFAYLNKSWPLATVSAVVNVGLSLAGILIGSLVFGERLRPLEKVGLAFGLVALFLFVIARAGGPEAPAGPAEPNTPTDSRP